jgi:hypothetical protein
MVRVNTTLQSHNFFHSKKVDVTSKRYKNGSNKKKKNKKENWSITWALEASLHQYPQVIVKIYIYLKEFKRRRDSNAKKAKKRA